MPTTVTPPTGATVAITPPDQAATAAGVQWFFVEVHHPDDPFSAAGDARTADPADWFELARRASLMHPGTDVLCSTLARCRRVYRDGVVAGDYPDWPYPSPRGDYRW